MSREARFARKKRLLTFEEEELEADSNLSYGVEVFLGNKSEFYVYARLLDVYILLY